MELSKRKFLKALRNVSVYGLASVITEQAIADISLRGLLHVQYLSMLRRKRLQSSSLVSPKTPTFENIINLLNVGNQYYFGTKEDLRPYLHRYSNQFQIAKQIAFPVYLSFVENNGIDMTVLGGEIRDAIQMNLSIFRNTPLLGDFIKGHILSISGSKAMISTQTIGSYNKGPQLHAAAIVQTIDSGFADDDFWMEISGDSDFVNKAKYVNDLRIQVRDIQAKGNDSTPFDSQYNAASQVFEKVLISNYTYPEFGIASCMALISRQQYLLRSYDPNFDQLPYAIRLFMMYATSDIYNHHHVINPEIESDYWPADFTAPQIISDFYSFGPLNNFERSNPLLTLQNRIIIPERQNPTKFSVLNEPPYYLVDLRETHMNRITKLNLTVDPLS